MKVIGIIGTRRRDSFSDMEEVWKEFYSIYEDGDEIVSGGCPEGGDRFAEVIAKKKQIPIKIYYAQWRKYGKSAGFIRNGLIAKAADMLIACVAEDRKGGTEHCIKYYLGLGKNKLIIV